MSAGALFPCGVHQRLVHHMETQHACRNIPECSLLLLMQQEEAAKRELRQEEQDKKKGSKVKSKAKQQATASKATKESEGLQEEGDTEGQGEGQGVHLMVKRAGFQDPGGSGGVGTVQSRGPATSAAAAAVAQSVSSLWCEPAQTLDIQRQGHDEQGPLPWQLAGHSRGQQQEKQQTKDIDIKQQQQRGQEAQQQSQQATGLEQTQQQRLQQSQGGIRNSSSSSKGRPYEQGTAAGYGCSSSATATAAAAAPEASYTPAKVSLVLSRDAQKGVSCSPSLVAPVAQHSPAVTSSYNADAASLLPPHLARCLEGSAGVLPSVPVASASLTAAVKHHHHQQRQQQVYQGLDQQPCMQRHQQHEIQQQQLYGQVEQRQGSLRADQQQQSGQVAVGLQVSQEEVAEEVCRLDVGQRVYSSNVGAAMSLCSRKPTAVALAKSAGGGGEQVSDSSSSTKPFGKSRKSLKARPGPCVVCWEAVPCVVLLPCRHLVVCEECFELLHSKGSHCPMCREPVEQHMVVFHG